VIQRLPKSFRYRITGRGLRTALFFTRLYNCLLRPGVAAVVPGHAAIDTPLRRAFDSVKIHSTRPSTKPSSSDEYFTHFDKFV
jgi:hypothetical protein